MGLLELARRFEDTNHLGLLVFDEPRQQETAELSFDSLLRRASLAGKNDQQVIFATSEEPERLEPLLSHLDCHYISIKGQIIKRRED